MSFLLEIYSEEIPARMQENAVKSLLQSTFDVLKKEKLDIKPTQINTFISARRIALTINNLRIEQISAAEKIIGPKIDANESIINISILCFIAPPLYNFNILFILYSHNTFYISYRYHKDKDHFYQLYAQISEFLHSLR